MSGNTEKSSAPAVWVDADACPAPIREIIFRAAERARVHVTLVANRMLRTPPSPYLRSVQVADGFDVADSTIVERLQRGDLVITQDIPLAARVLEKGGEAINPRGERYTPDTIAERLSMRNFMEELRGSGVQTGGPAPFHARDSHAFARQLDRWLATRPEAARPRKSSGQASISSSSIGESPVSRTTE
ncbi:MAG: YaiI/YqxD family protein [Chromatiales bacterium]|nr:YaiI/YqxD family protein [Chromatiales bacterium]